MKSLIRIPVVALLATIVVNITLWLLNSISLIDLETPMLTLMDTYDVSFQGDFALFQPWYSFWAGSSFLMVSTQGFIDLSFDLTYILLFIVFLLGVFVIGIFSKGKNSALISLLLYYIFNLLFAFIFATILANSVRVGALPPSEQELVKDMGIALTKLTVLIPVLVYNIAALINIVIAVVLLLFIAKKGKSKK